ncbi:MAG TPA: glycosyltransferase family 8 protein [Candidatus Gastranaerophilaceae bacterium]|nr:glycosyltransferase family 8 protein [Candidatus Gastranaerophilaceae bacterium]
MEKIQIALTYDDNYAQHSVVLIASILENKTGNEEIIFHILDGGLSDNSKKILQDIQGCEIKIHQVDKKQFEGYVKSDYYPVSMLWTMILPDIIKVEKLIYLDSDMVVNSSLKELWETDLSDNYVAAVEDANGKKYAKRYGLKDSKFFNTGTMLINCKKWLEDNIPQKAVEIAMKNTGSRWGYDQTVLNQLFEGKVKFLDLKWNLQYFPINVWATYDDKQEYKNAIKNPLIIHYVGDYKPWKKGLGCFNPKQQDYFKYHKITPYAFTDYNKWFRQDKLLSYKGLAAFIKRYPLFFLKKQFWKNMFSI